MLDIIQVQREIPAIGPDTVFTLFGFPVTSSLLLGIAIMLAIGLFGFFIIKRKYGAHPSKSQTLVEIMYEGMVDLIDQITDNRAISEKVIPLVGALFVFIGISNLIELIPGLTSITYGGTAIFRSPTTDFNTTFGLALAMVIVVQIASIKSWGIFGFLGKYFQFKQVYVGFRKGFGAGIMSIIEFLIGLLDIISEIAKVISLSFRLFGNLYAGQVLAVIILGFVASLLPTLWSGLGILFGVVQAIVFGALVTAYYTIGLKPEEVEDNVVATT